MTREADPSAPDDPIGRELAERGIHHPAAIARVRAAHEAGLDVPISILTMHPEIAPQAWERLSDVRWRAPHPQSQYAVLVVRVFGETLSVGVIAGTGEEERTFARLIGSAGENAARRVACEQRTPLVRPGGEGNYGVAGCCWWCGKLPVQHADASAG